MVITCKGQGNGGVKVIRVEGGREKEKEVIVRHEIVSSNGKREIMTICHVTGTRIIPSKKEK